MNIRVETIKINNTMVEYFQIDNCVYGNPRYVVHYADIDDNYNAALQKAREIGGKKYRAKWYGGGIVITTYSLERDLLKII